VVNLRFSGWIERLFVDQTGVQVRRGQPLFRIYSPELVAAQEEYLLALRTAGKESPLAQSARTRLTLSGLSEATIARIAQRGTAQRRLTITAPRAGFVLHKNVVAGARAPAGEDLFRIGKLSAIWVHARVYEFDAPWIRVGQPATMELSFQRGKLYQGKVSYIYPTLDEKTRTLTVRLEFVNPQLRLKPGMFTTVRIETRHQRGVLLIPTEAIMHSGERQLVFVTRGVGRYEPREIITGLAGDRHLTQVRQGLAEGEQVVVSGQFLLDSESQLREALQKMTDAGLQVAPRKARQAPDPQHHDHGHSAPASQKATPGDPSPPSSWTCPMHPQIDELAAGSCPICGMDLTPKREESR
jgi:Cu(I)/Ag(I) efflux system membrane fusion protein/cobalt-zinc-cadmium efflux system membrane fusion protein